MQWSYDLINTSYHLSIQFLCVQYMYWLVCNLDLIFSITIISVCVICTTLFFLTCKISCIDFQPCMHMCDRWFIFRKLQHLHSFSFRVHTYLFPRFRLMYFFYRCFQHLWLLTLNYWKRKYIITELCTFSPQGYGCSFIIVTISVNFF